MKLLITGGAGFLGSNLARWAIGGGHDVCVFDDLSRRSSSRNLNWLRETGEFVFIHGDVRVQNDISQVIAQFKPDSIFHLAGQVAMTTSISDPRKDFEVNVVGTFNVLESVRCVSPYTAVIYSSTNKVYGDLEWTRYRETDKRWELVDLPNGIDETAPLTFHSPYGVSKGAGDQYCLDYSRMYGLRTVVFRHSSMYGGRQFATAEQGWIGWFCQQALEQTLNVRSLPFTIAGDGKQVRDVLHADDMVTLYAAALENIDAAAGHAFNIGGGMDNSLSLLELFDLLQQITGTQLRFTRLPARASDQRVFVADIKKASHLLKWRPSIPARQGVISMYEWVREVYDAQS